MSYCDDIDLTLPDFLDRKKNGHVPDPLPKNVSWKLKDPNRIVWPKWTPEQKKREEEKPSYELTSGERDELTEIKAMVKTNVGLARSMAAEWISRIADKKVQARRRHWLKTVKGLNKRGG